MFESTIRQKKLALIQDTLHGISKNSKRHSVHQSEADIKVVMPKKMSLKILNQAIDRTPSKS